MDIPPPSHKEVKVAIKQLKNNKAVDPGIPAKLFKTGCNELVRRMYQLIYKIWLEESMRNDWNLNVLCPVLKKRGPTIFPNYWGASFCFAPIAYKVLTCVLCERLKPLVKTLIGPY